MTAEQYCRKDMGRIWVWLCHITSPVIMTKLLNSSRFLFSHLWNWIIIKPIQPVVQVAVRVNKENKYDEPASNKHSVASNREVSKLKWLPFWSLANTYCCWWSCSSFSLLAIYLLTAIKTLGGTNLLRKSLLTDLGCDINLTQLHFRTRGDLGGNLGPFYKYLL